LKIKQTVKENISNILSNGKVLLRLALDSLIESIRNDPAKYSSLIYYNMYEQKQFSSSQNYYNEYYKAMLVQDTEKLYNKLVNDLTNRIIYDAAVLSGSATS
jgi:hypothetical protein